MIQYKVTLDNGNVYFVLAQNFSESILTLTGNVRCAEYQESREYVCAAIASIEIWDTIKYRHETNPKVLEKNDNGHIPLITPEAFAGIISSISSSSRK